MFGLIVSVLLSIIYAFACAATLLERLAGRTLLLPAAEAFAFVDIDDTIRATYGYAKKGAGYGYSKVKGIQRADRDDHDPGGGAGDRREQAAEGSTNSARGVARLVADALATATRAGVDGLTILRADSAYYDHDVIAAVPVDPLTWFCQGPSVVLGMSRASAARRNHA